jgi:hypothetical protein
MPKLEPNTPWSQKYAQDVATGLAENGNMHHVGAIAGLSGLTGPWPRELTKEIESAIRPWYTPAREVFAGEFPTGCTNAQVRIFPEGYLFLIDREIIQLLYDFVYVIHKLRLQFRPSGFSIVPEEEAFGEGFNDIFVKSVAAILLHHLHRLSRNEASASINRLDNWARARRDNNPFRGDSNDTLIFEFGYFAQVVKACLAFLIAHEYGHIIAGHLDPYRTARIQMAHGEPLIVAAKAIDEEREADNLASKVLQSVMEYRYRHSGHPIETHLILAGPRLFFCIDAAIQHAFAKISAHATQENGSDHPPPEERLRQHDAFFKPFYDIPNLSLLPHVYSSWLTPTLKAMPQAIDQLESV